MIRTTSLSLAAAFLVAPTFAAPVELVTNGDFENANASQNPDGWTLTADASGQTNFTRTTNAAFLSPFTNRYSASQAAYFHDDNNFTNVAPLLQQTFTPVVLADGGGIAYNFDVRIDDTFGNGQFANNIVDIQLRDDSTGTNVATFRFNGFDDRFQINGVVQTSSATTPIAVDTYYNVRGVIDLDTGTLSGELYSENDMATPVVDWSGLALENTPASFNLIRIFDGQDAGTGQNAHIDNVSLLIPEPASIALLAAGGALTLLRRR